MIAQHTFCKNKSVCNIASIVKEYLGKKTQENSFGFELLDKIWYDNKEQHKIINSG